MNKLKIFASINKVDDEQKLVSGYASTEALDFQGERVAKSAIEKALPDYMIWKNVREMHNPHSAVGVTEEAVLDEKGLYITVKVEDDNAWKKVKSGVYKGFSIGGEIITKIKDTITDLYLTEISLVDRPANPEAIFNVFKAADIEIPNNSEEEIIKEEIKEESPDINKVDSQKELEEFVKTIVSNAIDSVLNQKTEINKGMYAVSNLAQLLASLEYLQQDVKFEAEYEGDNSKLPAKLKSAMGSLVDILRMMVDEETTEMMAEKSEKTIDIEKSIKNDSNELIQKMATFEEKLLKIQEENQILKNKLEKFENMPAAPKSTLKTVDKGQNYKVEKREESQNALTAMNEVFAAGGTPFYR